MNECGGRTANNAEQQNARRQMLVLAGIAVTFWFASAVGAFQSVYLQENGFSAAQYGVLSAICSGVVVLAVSFWGVVSDRIGSLKKVLLLVMAVGFSSYALVPAIPTALPCSVLLFTVLVPCIKVFHGPMEPLAENLLVRDCAELRLDYGRIRGIASFSYAIGGIAATFLIARTGVASTFCVSGLFGISCLALLFRVRDADNGFGRAKRLDAVNLRLLARNGRYLSFLVFYFLFYMAVNSRMSFLPYYMDAIGLASDRYGVVLAYDAFLEIPSLLLLGRLHSRFRYRQLVILSVCLEMTEAVLLGTVCSSLLILVLCTTFYGLGNGIFIASSLNYIYELAPVSLKASAQGFCSAAASVAGVLGNLLGGILFDRLGAKPFYLALLLVYAASFAVLAFSEKKRAGGL